MTRLTSIKAKTRAPLRVIPAHTKRRNDVLELIQRQFRTCFGAHVVDDTDELFAIVDANDQVVGGFGLERNIRLFQSRHYAGCIFSQLVTTFGGIALDAKAVELRHLSVANRGIFCSIAPLLAQFLAKQADYLVCTATAQIVGLLKSQRLTPRIIADALIQDLPAADREQWGSYYSQKPQVMLGDLAAAKARYANQILDHAV